MPSLSIGEIMLIFIVALVVFGPRRLPEIGRIIGKALNEFRKATDELKSSIEREVRADEFKQAINPTVSRNEPVEVTAETATPEPTPQPPEAEPPSVI